MDKLAKEVCDEIKAANRGRGASYWLRTTLPISYMSGDRIKQIKKKA